MHPTDRGSHNALAETINGLYKTELIKPGKPWRSIEDVEPPHDGSSGSTIAASTNTAAMSRRSRLPITLNAGDQPPAEISHRKGLARGRFRQ